MNQTDLQDATQMMDMLRSRFLVAIERDWGDETGTWQSGFWVKDELEKLLNTLSCLADCVGGAEKLKEFTGGVTIKKADIGTHGGEALKRRVTFSTKSTFSPWTVVHEFAHAWDAKYDWKLSVALERYTGGYTNWLSSLMKKAFGKPDSGIWNSEKTPGRYGRLPGCNLAGYFYGDKPSGSNWSFNRKEDFAESVAMYVGWGRGNDLSEWAQARINRYLLPNGAADRNFGVDNWTYYREYFYPENGDYAKTKRWHFVDDLVHGRIRI